MPCFLILGWIAQVVSRRRRFATFVAAAVGFALPLALLLSWLWLHPEMARQTVARYSPVGTSQLTPLQRVKDFLNYNNVQEKISIYWDYFNPAFLFFSGGSNLTMATRKAGVFLLSRRASCSCAAPSIGCDTHAPSRLVSCCWAASSSRRFRRRSWTSDMPSSARSWCCRSRRSWPHTESRGSGGNRHDGSAPSPCCCCCRYRSTTRISTGTTSRTTASGRRTGSIRSISATSPSMCIAADAAGGVPAVYFAEDLDDVGARWRFYLAKSGRDDVAAADALLPARSLRRHDRGARAACSCCMPTTRTCRVSSATGQWSVAKTIDDAATGSPTAVILRRNA